MNFFCCLAWDPGVFTVLLCMMLFSLEMQFKWANQTGKQLCRAHVSGASVLEMWLAALASLQLASHPSWFWSCRVTGIQRASALASHTPPALPLLFCQLSSFLPPETVKPRCMFSWIFLCLIIQGKKRAQSTGEAKGVFWNTDFKKVPGTF